MSDVVFERWGGGQDVPPASPEIVPASSAPLRLTVRPGDRPGEEVSFERWGAPDSAPGYIEDIARSVPSGLVKGATALLGLPRVAADLAAQNNEGWQSALIDGVAERFGLPPEWATATKQVAKAGFSFFPLPGAGMMPTTEQMRAGVDRIAPGVLRQPKTLPGKYAETIAEFVPGAGRKLVTMAAAPGVVSETVGQMMQGSKYEPVARAGAAIAAGGLGALLTRPRSAQQAIRNEMPADGLPPHVIDDAQRVIDEGARRGIAVTWPEAIEQVAPGQGTGLLNTQRLLESQRDTRGQLAPLFAARPAQIETAARGEFDRIAPASAAPSSIGPQAARAATETLRDVRGAINNATRPLYNAAASQRIDPQTFARVSADPVFQEGLRRVRNDPFIGPTLQHYTDDSIAVIDAVKKQLDETGRNLRSPAAGTARNNYSAVIVEQGRDRAVRAADVATGSRPGVMGSYETARAVQQEARRQFLEPLLQGPLGKIARNDVTTQKAIDALFPRNPLPGSEEEIATAVAALARRNNLAARQLVRAHAESTFNEAAQNIQAGANQWGGASFAAAIVGNPQQRANLREAVRALGRDGDEVWRGFNSFLQIVEATGKRQRVGSRTAFNAQDLKDLASGRLPSEAGKVAAAPQRMLTVLGDAWGRWQLGRNLEEISAILTDRRAGPLLRAIANRPSTSNEAAMIAARLIGMGLVGHRHAAKARE